MKETVNVGQLIPWEPQKLVVLDFNRDLYCCIWDWLQMST